jgi:hypothetical protein
MGRAFQIRLGNADMYILDLAAMDLSARKEEFSRAYVKVVAAACGFATAQPTVDNDSVDLTLAARGGDGTTRSPRLDIQLKCTSQQVLAEETVNLPLPVHNYEQLRPTNFMVPRILVVVIVPEDLADWLKHTEQELLIRHCGYWYSLRGFPATDNTETVTVNIPRTQVFDVAGVTDMMGRLAAGGLP